MKKSFIKAVFWMSCNLWLLWSRFYRYVFEGKQIRNTNISKYPTLEYLGIILKQTDWVVEPIGNTIISPEHFQYSINTNRKPRVGRDCDDYGAYAFKCCETIPNVTAICNLSVYWKEKWFLCFKRIKGHAVCVVQDSSGDVYHVGNWGSYRIINLQCPLSFVYDDLIFRIIANRIAKAKKSSPICLNLYNPISLKHIKTLVM